MFSFGIFAQITLERLLSSTGKTFYTLLTQGTGAIVNIILDQIKDQFISETVCVTYFLDVTKEEWEDWKKGLRPLPSEKMQKLKSLFSDYEL